MNFLRWSFLPREGAGELFPDRCSGDRQPPLRFPVRMQNASRRSMRPRDGSRPQVSERSRSNNSELHAELRDVPLPAGFMLRIRQIVDFGIDEAEARSEV